MILTQENIDLLMSGLDEAARGVDKMREAILGLVPQPAAPTQFSQRDPRWADDRQGTMKGTLGKYGCWVTSVASIRTDAGEPITPAELNDWLNKNGGYHDGAYLVSPDAPVKNSQRVRFDRDTICQLAPAPLKDMAAWLAAGNFCVVEVDSDADAELDTHFMRLLSVDVERDQVEVMDPWPLPGGNLVSIPPAYKNKEWHTGAGAIILRVVWYRKV